MKDKELLKELIERGRGAIDGYFEYAQIVAILLPKNLHDSLRQLVNGPVHDGDIISKSYRDELIDYGLATRCMTKGEQGYTTALYFALPVIKAINERRGRATDGKAGDTSDILDYLSASIKPSALDTTHLKNEISVGVSINADTTHLDKIEAQLTRIAEQQYKIECQPFALKKMGECFISSGAIAALKPWEDKNFADAVVKIVNKEMELGGEIYKNLNRNR